MPYNKQIFVDGEVLTAEQLNNMEQGIFDAMKLAEEGGDGSGGTGKDGGYYTPAVTQPTADTMQVSYTPSSSDMPTVAPVTVTLPGKDGTENVFIAEYGVTTYDEIAAAVAEGKAVFCLRNNITHVLANLGSANTRTANFYCPHSDRNMGVALLSSGSWTFSNSYLQTTNQKTQTVSADSTTDQYPSAKAVYDYGQTLVDDVIAALPVYNGEVEEV